MSRILGLVLIIDAILSLILPQDKQFLWQLGRIIRLGIGIYFVIV